MSNRIKQLDSIRGLAAFTVFLHHIYLIFPILPMIFWYSPLRILVNGHASVILFFVLSGFVLALPYFYGTKQKYLSYLIKRICRIYIPYLVSISFAIALVAFLPRRKIEELGDWFNLFWQSSPNYSLIMEHLILIGNVHSNAFNTVIWSLVHELRISIIFPFLIVIVGRFNWKVNILLCLIFSFIGGLNEIFHFQRGNGFHNTYFDTIHYTSIFIIGALLAKHRVELIEWHQSLSIKAKWFWIVIGFFSYNYAGSFKYIIKSPFSNIIGEYGMALGASVFILSSLSLPQVKSFLLKKPILFLGKISYSIYLYHVIVLLTLIYSLYNIIPLWLILILSIPIGLLISTFAWYFVEKPSIRIGRTLAKKIDKHSVPEYREYRHYRTTK